MSDSDDEMTIDEAFMEMGENPPLSDADIEAIRCDVILAEVRRIQRKVNQLLERMVYYQEAPATETIEQLKSDIDHIIKNYGP